MRKAGDALLVFSVVVRACEIGPIREAAMPERSRELAAGTSAPSRFVVDVHQQYLAKNPPGYRCHATTGVKFPEIA